MPYICQRQSLLLTFNVLVGLKQYSFSRTQKPFLHLVDRQCEEIPHFSKDQGLSTSPTVDIGPTENTARNTWLFTSLGWLRHPRELKPNSRMHLTCSLIAASTYLRTNYLSLILLHISRIWLITPNNPKIGGKYTPLKTSITHIKYKYSSFIHLYSFSVVPSI